MDLTCKEKPYYTVNDFYKDKFQAKVFKVPLNGGFTCPNRDGTLSDEGCIYCSEAGAGEFAGKIDDSLAVQYDKIKAVMLKKWPEGRPIVYFQANTNTYAPLNRLKELYETALSLDEDIVGISLATRPDCLPDDVIEYLDNLNQTTFVTVELGLQTIHDKTAQLINRRHTLEAFTDAVARLHSKNIHTVVHVINGLPQETKAMMLDTIRYLNQLPLQGIKLHMLYVTKNTKLGRLYEADPFTLLSQAEYCEIVASQIEIMRPDLIVYRLTGDAPRTELIAPIWTMKKLVVTNTIDKILRKRQSYQGRCFINDQDR